MKLRFIDLFAGLGGFHQALESLGHECVFASEIDPELREIYRLNFGMTPAGDIRRIDAAKIPSHDILCAGFPCQPFSKAGFQLGWEDEIRGSLFGNIVQILKEHQPKYVILENVGNFDRHDHGNTWRTVKSSLEALDYNVQATEHKSNGGPGLISPHHLGFPHHRERFFIVASMEDLPERVFPTPDRNRRTYMEEVVQDRIFGADKIATKLSQQQYDCIEHWNKLLKCLPESVLDHLPSFPIWGDELHATYPYEDKTPSTLLKRDLIRHVGINGNSSQSKLSRTAYLDMLPAYATRSGKFPDWKIRFIKQNREWFKLIERQIPTGWARKLIEFPPSLRKLEWNCKGEDRNLWTHILQFRSSGLRVKRYENSPSLVAMTTTQIPILGPKRRFMTRTEGLRILGFPDGHEVPKNRADAFQALGNAVHVGVARVIFSRLSPPRQTAETIEGLLKSSVGVDLPRESA